tara:strand:+ start:245 stop:1855 length:1611 start_codon:yes stop_codon:yes gene_type:complete
MSYTKKPEHKYRVNLFFHAHKLLLVLFVIIVFGPLLVLFIELFKSILAGKADWVSLVFPVGRRFNLLFNSLVLSVSVSISGMLLGILTSLFLWRFKTGIGKYLRWLILMFICLPPYIHALSWTYAFNYVRFIPSHGMLVCWWVELMAYLPLAVGLSLLGLDSVEPVLVDAGRMMHGDISTLRRVILPQAKPVILAGGSLLFLLSLADYSIPSLFSVNVYSLEVFAEYSATNEPARALLLGVPLLVIAVILILFSYGKVNKVAIRLSRPDRKENALYHLPKWFIWLEKAAIGIVIMQMLVVVCNLLFSVGSFKNIALSTTSASDEIYFSFTLASVTALLCLPLAAAAANQLSKSETINRFWWFFLILPLVTPGSLIGMAFLILTTQYGFNFLYSSVWMPVLANLAQFTPLAVIIIWANLKRTDPLLVDASKVLQRNVLKGELFVRLPMMGAGFLSAACLVFILSLRELSSTIIVTPPGYTTLTARIYNYLHYGGSSEVAGLCLVLTVIFLTISLLCIIIFTQGSLLFIRRRRKQCFQ